jgi:hypothetical protein
MLSQSVQRLLVVVASSALLVAGCQNRSRNLPSPDATTSVQSPIIVSDSTPSADERAKLLAAKEALFSQLSSRLTEALAAQGPVGAIQVCQVEAKSIAAAVGEQANVKLGRTGVRLRNTDNHAPAWATELVAQQIDTPVFARLSNGHAVALLPIKLQPPCLMCHGPREMLAPEVIDQLAKLYPQDQATGFSEGELRGWFWIESLD